MAASILLGAPAMTSAAPIAQRATPSPFITPRDISTLLGVQDPQIAPDGHEIIYTRTTPTRASAPTPPELWTVSTGPRPVARRLRGALAGDHMPRWSPDGRTLALIRSQPDDPQATGPHLVLTDVKTRRAHVVTTLPGAPLTYRWSPDGRSIAIITNETAPAQPHDVTIEGDEGTHHLVLLDVASLKIHIVPTPEPCAFDVDWGPNGDRLVVRSGREAGLDYYWYRSVAAVIKTDGTLVLRLPGRATAAHASFSPDGQRIVYGYFADDGIAGLVGYVDLATAERQPIGADWGGSILHAKWDSDSHGLTVLGFKGVQTILGHVRLGDAADNTVTPVAALMGAVFEFSADNAGDIALVASTRTEPDDVWLYHGSAGRQLTQSNPAVAAWPLGEQRVVHWKASDGLDLSGIPVLPLFVQLHGGPLEAWYDGWLGSWHNWARLLASHGIAVFMPNPRGSEGGNSAFSIANRGDWGSKDYQDILAGVDALERDGIADPAHLALGGWSYGGFMGMWAAGHNDRFKAIIAGAGIADLMSMALATDVGFSFIPPYFGDTIDKHDYYTYHSPI